MVTTERQTYNVDEAAKILGISRYLCYQGIREKTIPAVKIGHRYLVPKNFLETMDSNMKEQLK